MLRTEKTEKIAELKELFDKSTSFFVTDYQGLDVPTLTVLRKELRDNKVKYLVAKNTLIRLAAKEAGIEGIDEHLNGPTAIAFATEDASVAAKILYESTKKHDLPRFKIFCVEGQLHQADEIKALAELPPRDILLSQIVAAVEAPFAELVGSLDGFFRELVGSIDALEEKKKGE